jgi:hypothetical protein
MQALVARNVNVNEADYDGRTALHVAACEGHVDAVAYLLRLGADAKARDRFGHTPLDDALRQRQQAVADLLGRASDGAGAVVPVKATSAQSLVAAFRSIPMLGLPPNAAVTPTQIGAILRSAGLAVDRDSRIQAAFARLPAAVTEGDFMRLLAAHPVLPKAFEGRLAVPDFPDLRSELTRLFDACQDLTTGTIPSFPPLLASANKRSYALAACTVDGQVCSNGTAADPHCIYSLGKVRVRACMRACVRACD